MVEEIHGSSIQGPKSPISQPQPQQPQGPQLLPRNVPGTEDSGQKEGKKYQGPGQGVPASDFGIQSRQAGEKHGQGQRQHLPTDPPPSKPMPEPPHPTPADQAQKIPQVPVGKGQGILVGI